MHPSTAPSLTQTLTLITNLLSLLLTSSLTVQSFITRWKTIQSKLALLQSSISTISSSPHFSENQLLQDLIPNILTLLLQTQSLSQQCQSNPEGCYKGGKLLMQSNIDIASAQVSTYLHDLDLLIKSGVLQQSNAIVLSQPAPGSDNKQDLEFFIRDLFARLQIGGIEFKKKALESLLKLLRDDDKAAVLVAKEGENVRYLIHLLELNHNSSIREQAVIAVSVLASVSESSRKCVFEEGGLGPLLRLLEFGSSNLKERAAMAVEAITDDPENAWAISAYGGVSVLIEACQSGTPITQMHAAGAIKNIAIVEEIRVALGEEGAVEVLLQLLVSGTSTAQEKSANCLWILASDREDFRVSILELGGLQNLLQLLQKPLNTNTLEHVLRAISALSVSDRTLKILSSSTAFLLQLAELINNTTLPISFQQISVSILSKLSISDVNKRSLSSCMASLVKMVEFSKSAGLQETAAEALVSLLSVRSNRKELVKDEKSLSRLVQMLDPNTESVCKKLPVVLISTIVAGGSNGCRKRLILAGACHHLQKLSQMEVVGAKKVLQRLVANRLKNIFSRTWRD